MFIFLGYVITSFLISIFELYIKLFPERDRIISKTPENRHVAACKPYEMPRKARRVIIILQETREYYFTYSINQDSFLEDDDYCLEDEYPDMPSYYTNVQPPRVRTCFNIIIGIITGIISGVITGIVLLFLTPLLQ